MRTVKTSSGATAMQVLWSWRRGSREIEHPDGRPVHADTITDRFNRLVDRAGAKRIRLHDVRHTYATVFRLRH